MRDIVDCVGDSRALREDLLKLLVGEPISRGAHREVFALLGRPNEVVKIEAGSGNFFNILEWETWCAVQGTRLAKWFAPCVTISDCGSALIMERTHPVAKVPARLPALFQDVKPENFGMLEDGRVVCHDYAISWLIRSNLRGMKRAA